jgi:CRISPR-associated protein Cas2
MAIPAFRVMWLFVLFDLPVASRTERREYARFRKQLLSLGFTKLQFSVYAKHLPSGDAAENQKRTIAACLPPGGQVRLLAVTDHQFGQMEVYEARKRTRAEPAPLQISLF